MAFSRLADAVPFACPGVSVGLDLRLRHRHHLQIRLHLRGQAARIAKTEFGNPAFELGQPAARIFELRLEKLAGRIGLDRALREVFLDDHRGEPLGDEHRGARLGRIEADRKRS